MFQRENIFLSSHHARRLFGGKHWQLCWAARRLRCEFFISAAEYRRRRLKVSRRTVFSFCSFNFGIYEKDFGCCWKRSSSAVSPPANSPVLALTLGFSLFIAVLCKMNNLVQILPAFWKQFRGFLPFSVVFSFPPPVWTAQ